MLESTPAYPRPGGFGTGAGATGDLQVSACKTSSGSSRESSAHGAPRDLPLAHFRSILGSVLDTFLIFFATLSATTRFRKICTAPTRELDFRGRRLPKNTHLGSLLPLIFRTFSRPPSGAPFWRPLVLNWCLRAGFGDPLWIPLAPKQLH